MTGRNAKQRSQIRLTAEPESLLGTPWEQEWSRVPDEWRTGQLAIDQTPFCDVFVQNARYRPGRVFDFVPPGHERLGNEECWWLWTVWREGLRKVDPSMLRWWSTAIGQVAAARHGLTGKPVLSVADIDPDAVVREAERLFRAKNGRLPGAGSRRNLASIARHIHLMVSVRCSNRRWWEHDVWDLTIDKRIPRREHEPYLDRAMNLSAVEPRWLREGLRFWLSRCLTYDLLAWTTCVNRASLFSAYIGPYMQRNAVAYPALVRSPDELRPAMMHLLSWLRSSEATTLGRPLAASGITHVQTAMQAFYTFMIDNKSEAITVTGDQRWNDLVAEHSRLWPPEYRSRRARTGGSRTVSWIGQQDVHRMVCALPILGAPTGETITVELPEGESLTAHGLGDPHAMRAWLLQAMTGRRASEILMLDFDPLTALDGVDPTTANDDDFVARLRYQQTKVEDVDPVILVEAAVVNIIREQQDATRQHGHSSTAPAYLFTQLRHNHQGLRPRPYRSYIDALKRLDKVTKFLDSAGKPLRYTQTHRLRHTRATELLNAGVPVHVVQRYLGHKSPEMTMWYAETLASVSEAEFLRYKKVGADGKDIGVDPKDLYEIAQLDRRTDRILPNGLCMLPPAKSCERGNACLSCVHFATDSTSLADHEAQLAETRALVAYRQEAFASKHGVPMDSDNVWLVGRRREIASLEAIIARLRTADDSVVRGAGTGGRQQIPITPVTHDAHKTVLDGATRPRSE